MSELDFLFINPRPGPIYDPAESQRMIDEHIRKHGVTRCPVAFATVTQNATVDPQNIAALHDRAEVKAIPGRKRAKWQKQATANAALSGRAKRADLKATAWTPARLAELQRLYDSHGSDWVTIGAALGISRYAALGTYTRLRNGRYAGMVALHV